MTGMAGMAGAPSAADAVRAASRWSRMTGAHVATGATPEPDSGRYAAADLADAATGLAARVVRDHADALGLPPGPIPARQIASLVVQRYSHRVCLLAVSSFAADGRALDLRADAVVAEFSQGLPTRLLLPEPRWLDADRGDLGALLEAVLEGHLVPVGLAFREVSGLGVPHLWANLAASFGLAVRVVARHRGVETARALGEAIAGSRPRLARGGRYRDLVRDGAVDLFYDRSSCCLWVDLPGGRYCTACSRLTPHERARRFAGSLTHANAPGSPGDRAEASSDPVR